MGREDEEVGFRDRPETSPYPARQRVEKVAEQIVTVWWIHQQDDMPAHECARTCLEPAITDALALHAAETEKKVWEEHCQKHCGANGIAHLPCCRRAGGGG